MNQADINLLAVSLARLLYHHEKVVLPGIGAFKVQDKQAQIHPVSHEFTPPTRVLGFDPSDVDNDGLLVREFMRLLSTGEQAARDSLFALIEDMKRSLDAGTALGLKGIGELARSPKGELGFQAAEGQNFLPSSFGLAGFTSPPIARTATRSVPPSETPAPETVKGTAPETTREPVTGHAGAKTPLAGPTVQKEEQSAPPMATAEEGVAEDVSHDAGGRKKLGWLWFLLSIVALAFVAWFWWPHWELTWQTWQDSRSRTEMPSSPVHESPAETDMSATRPLPATTAASDTLQEPTGSPAEAEAQSEPETPVIATTSQKYFIIAGCFRSRTNAENLLTELRAKGYPASIQGTTKKGLHRVCYQGFSDFDEANVELRRILKEENSGAWLINLEYDPQ